MPDTITPAQAEAESAPADPLLTERLSTRISQATDERLRLFLTIRRRPLGATVDELCARGLPTLEELSAEVVARKGSGDANR